MDFQEYIRKVYTLAYRLTGEEASALDVTSLAVQNNAINIKEDSIDLNILYKTAAEVCSIFLSDPDKYISGDKSKNMDLPMQTALLSLEPLSRTAVVWRDVMGFKIDDLAAASNCPKSELYKKLHSARGTVGTVLKCPTWDSGDGSQVSHLVCEDRFFR